MQQSSNGMFSNNGDGHPSSQSIPIDTLPQSQTHIRASLEDRSNTAILPPDEIDPTYSSQYVDFRGDHIKHIDDVFGAFGQGIYA